MLLIQHVCSYLSVFLLHRTKSIFSVILFQLCSWPSTANVGDLSANGVQGLEGNGGNALLEYLQVPCTPVQIEMDVFYFAVLCEFVVDVFFRRFLMNSSDKENPAFNSYGGRE